jgi:hypothetical protein
MSISGRAATALLAACLAGGCAAAEVAPRTSSSAPAASASKADLSEIQHLLDDKLIVGGATFYRIAAVRGIDDTEGALTLHADVDPLFAARYSGNPDGTDAAGRLYYDVTFDSTLPCGAAALGTTVDTPDFLVFDGKEFVTPREFVASNLPGRKVNAWERPINRMAAGDLQRLQTCAREVRTRVDAQPYSRIALYAADAKPVFEIRRTTSPESNYEEGLGEDTIAQLAYLELTPRGVPIEDFSVEVQAVSTMHCDYEGPHLELGGWQQGLSKPFRLQREGNRFLLGPAAFSGELPEFPAYTHDELRRAIAQHLGGEGLATEEEAAPCAPFLGGYKLIVRRKSAVVHQVFLAYPGGC